MVRKFSKGHDGADLDLRSHLKRRELVTILAQGPAPWLLV